MNIDQALLNIINSYKLAQQPDASFEIIAKSYEHLLPFIFLTYLLIDQDKAKRIFTTNQHYPVGAYEDLGQNDWTNSIIKQQRSLYYPNEQALKQGLEADYELIVRLGAASCLNVPVVFNGKTIGAVNLCAKANAYSQSQIKQAEIIAITLAPILANLLHLGALQ